MRQKQGRIGLRKWRLGDLLGIKHGYAFKGEFFSTSGTHIVLTPGNFFDEGGFKNKGENEKWYTGPIPEDYILRKGDLIVAMTEQAEGLLGSSAIIPKSEIYLHNQRLGLVQIVDDSLLDKYFLYYLFNTRNVRAQIRASANGAKVRHTSPSRIYEVNVDIPNVDAQRRIASILGAYDDLIENNLRRIKILEEMAQNLYREWFVNFRFPGHKKHGPRPATNEACKPTPSPSPDGRGRGEGASVLSGRGRGEGSFHESGWQPSPLGPIPTGWEVTHVENLVERIPSGKKYDQKTASSSGLVPILDQGKSGIIGYHDDEPGVMASQEDPVIVFANHTCYQRLISFSFSAIQNVLPFIPSKNYSRNIYWLHLATKDLVAFNDYKGHWPEFMSKKCLVPSEIVTHEFGRIVKPTFQILHTLERKNNVLRRTRDLLLPKLISGEVEVTQGDFLCVG